MAPRLPRIRENVENADWLHLGKDEEVHWVGRPSLYTIASATVGGVLLAVVGIALTLWLRSRLSGTAVPDLLGFLPLILTVAGLWWAALAYLNWVRLLYVITDEELYVKYGLISRDVTQVPLNRVQNTGYEQSVLERLLQYGDIHVYTAGTSTEDITFQSVPKPEQVKGTLTELLSQQSRKSNEREMGMD